MIIFCAFGSLEGGGGGGVFWSLESVLVLPNPIFIIRLEIVIKYINIIFLFYLKEV